MGKNLPIILDIEASGFGKGSFPIEVGYILPNQQRFCCLIKPQPDWLHWDTEAEQLHKIKRQVLFDCGKPAVEVVRSLNDNLAGKRVYTDAWGQDYAWLHKLYNAVDCIPSFKLEPLYALLKPGQLANWHSDKNQLQQKLALTRHRASNDAALLQACYAYRL